MTKGIKMRVETINETLTKAEVIEELKKRGFTDKFINNKSKTELAKLLAEAESPKKADSTSRIPKCEVY